MGDVIDCDAHVIEGRELVGELLERFPQQIRLSRDGEDGAFMIEGRPYPMSRGPGAGCPPTEGLRSEANPFTVDGVIADAEREGIEKMVFFPSVALAAPSIEDPTFGAELARRYNAWLAGYCKQRPGRLYGVAVVPIEHVDASIAIMREAKELGLVATMIPAALRHRNLDDPELEPFFAAAEELRMPLGVHTAPGIHLPTLGSERFDNYLQVHAVSFPFDMMVATTALTLGGVFERHPKLRVALLESGVGWVPYFFDRLDEHFEKRGRLTPACKREPHEYLARGQLYVSCEPEEAAIAFAADVLGPYFILYASDYPHWDSDFPDSTRPLRQRKDLTDVVRGRILRENAKTFFAFAD